ncbi:MAG: YbaB/EbfC family nucleoid-associated protein [Bacilli bacterium]|jgi:DNA-binding YbaB/EbfC family protein|nr:YbaB/EbfC family nucleoid-associated protein [Bacilli bacterium]
MDINKMMKQAQQMQAKIEKAQAELESSEFSKITQGIDVKAYGNKQIISIDIDNELMDDVEMLQDMIVVAINELFKDIDDETTKLMQGATGNLNIPGLF